MWWWETETIHPLHVEHCVEKDTWIYDLISSAATFQIGDVEELSAESQKMTDSSVDRFMEVGVRSEGQSLKTGKMLQYLGFLPDIWSNKSTSWQSEASLVMESSFAHTGPLLGVAALGDTGLWGQSTALGQGDCWDKSQVHSCPLSWNMSYSLDDCTMQMIPNPQTWLSTVLQKIKWCLNDLYVHVKLWVHIFD